MTSEPDLRAFSAHLTCITCALFVHLVCIPTLPCNVSGQVCVMCVCASYAHSKALLRTIVAFVSILPRPERKRIQCRPGPGRRECAPIATPPGVGCTSLLRMHMNAHECTKRGAPWHLAKIGGKSAECAKVRRKCAVNARKCARMRVAKTPTRPTAVGCSLHSAAFDKMQKMRK